MQSMSWSPLHRYATDGLSLHVMYWLTPAVVSSTRNELQLWPLACNVLRASQKQLTTPSGRS